MININGNEFYTADDAVRILDMKYSSVIFLLRKNRIPKYNNKYCITKEQMEKLRTRKNQYTKSILLTNDELTYEKSFIR